MMRSMESAMISALAALTFSDSPAIHIRHCDLGRSRSMLGPPHTDSHRRTMLSYAVSRVDMLTVYPFFRVSMRAVRSHRVQARTCVQGSGSVNVTLPPQCPQKGLPSNISTLRNCFIWASVSPYMLRPLRFCALDAV